MKSVSRIWPCVAICVLFLGCATVGSSTKPLSGLLPRPGAKIALGSISNATNQTFDFDLEAMLRDAIAVSIQKENLSVGGAQGTADFVLALQITDYRPGNAFKRWLVPGYGSTVLVVQGDLRDARNNSVVASIDHQRSVFAGGLFSVGAWKTIFTSVADDIAHDLRVRIEQEPEFVLDLPPRSDRGIAREPGRNPIAIKLGAMSDKRPEAGRIGERYAAFGVSMGDVYLSRDVAAFLRESVADELLIMGHRIVDSGEDVRAMGEVRKFWITTKTTPLYWDIVGEIEFDLLIESARSAPNDRIARSYSCKATDRTFVWPTASVMGKVMDGCLEELGQKIRSDNAWALGVPAASGMQ